MLLVVVTNVTLLCWDKSPYVTVTPTYVSPSIDIVIMVNVSFQPTHAGDCDDFDLIILST